MGLIAEQAGDTKSVLSWGQTKKQTVRDRQQTIGELQVEKERLDRRTECRGGFVFKVAHNRVFTGAVKAILGGGLE